jgi:hypothetical protein
MAGRRNGNRRVRHGRRRALKAGGGRQLLGGPRYNKSRTAIRAANSRIGNRSAPFDSAAARSLSNIKYGMIFLRHCTDQRSELFAATFRIGRAHG